MIGTYNTMSSLPGDFNMKCCRYCEYHLFNQETLESTCTYNNQNIKIPWETNCVHFTPHTELIGVEIKTLQHRIDKLNNEIYDLKKLLNEQN